MDEMDADTIKTRQARRARAWQLAFAVNFALLVAVTSFGGGMLFERGVVQNDGWSGVGDAIGSLRSDGGDGFTRVDDVRQLIEDEYYYRPADDEAEEAFRKDLEYDAIQGMTAGLEDEHTTFLVPVEAAPVAAQMSGEYEGIGVWVEYPDGAVTIVAAMPGSPAEAAGLKAGDVIEAADGTPLTGLTEGDALALVRGPAGTSVRLTIRRPDAAAPLDVEVERRAIAVPSVTYQLLPDSKVALIRASVFNDQTTPQLDRALASATADGAVGIVLDLRNNGGGWVQSAQEMIGRFVPEETGVALYEDTDPNDEALTDQPIVGGGPEVFDLPLAVLVNGGTASAAEIVAGALRDHDRARVVGEQTFGKGSVQRVHDFPDGSSARVTFALWLTPDKIAIEAEGIAPDVAVTNPDPVDGAAPTDAQLDRAVAEVAAG